MCTYCEFPGRHIYGPLGYTPFDIHRADVVKQQCVSGLYIDSYIHDPRSLLRDQHDLLPFVARVFGCQDTTCAYGKKNKNGTRWKKGKCYFLIFQKIIKACTCYFFALVVTTCVCVCACRLLACVCVRACVSCVFLCVCRGLWMFCKRALQREQQGASYSIIVDPRKTSKLLRHKLMGIL